ncbi:MULTISPECIES: alpha-L-fucosidase [unclassified Streptomyces]|uniref:alpha-L-fucosidase n=1 Tax=unclassified Streptomyces TaxID=2593676 RepID=UPI002DD91DC3|nr:MULTISPECIES: alpha-L-fucosidase [unclassified Streptomyces]WSC40531.1 alpha-L-fucosidase [Streptomyces sp. NBC_01763]WSC52361.1 alpha-L-fucosidase [Streptomyces sp. NBC_01761]WSF83210.1 alpha-L-fucosidase [Streptomyces sp. NBC_01744]
MAAALLGAPAATAEVQHPRQQWMRESTAGLFLHWGMFTAPRHVDCEAWEHDVTAGGWTADYWVDEARKLGASYIVLATFHSRLGYARPWPSKIPGSCSTERDFLGELVNAGKAKGIKVMLYMTDDPQWHNEVPGVQTLDSDAYSAYKGEKIDLTTREGFGRFSYDQFFEVMENYPDLAGFWIDNDNEYWENHHLYEQIRAKRPSWLLTNNNEDTPIMDTVSNEQKTGMTPAYDYPSAAFTPMPRISEGDYKLPTSGDWWYDGKDHPVDFRLSTGRYITNAGSSMKSLMAETAMVNGRFPPSQQEYNDFMADWTAPIRSSLQGTEGGGYMYGGMQPGFWNDGAHGVVTVGPGARTQYVHVVTRPGTDLVRLRDNGYRATKVTDVRTGKVLAFSQSGGYLTILGIADWDPYDTVFKVETDGRQQSYYPQNSLRATASSAATGHPATDVVDGSHENYWDSDGKLPTSVTIDLGSRRKATSLAVNQREWSPTHARSTFGRPEDSARIKDYSVSTSDDGRHWRTVRTGALPSARGVQFIDIGERTARYLKLEVRNTWAGPQAPDFFGRLRIDEIKVAHGAPVSGSAQVPLEAESRSNDRDGGVRPSACGACSGSSRLVGFGGGARNSVTFRDVTAAEAGNYRLQFDHTAGSATSLSVRVNGAAAIDVAVPAGNPDVPGSTAVSVPLVAGANTVQVFSRGARGPGLDRIAVGPLPPTSYVPKTTMTVDPHGLQWVGAGQQSIKVTAKLRLDADDILDGVRLAPKVPAGWSVEGDPATASSMRLGETLEASWTLTSPPGADVASTTVPVTAAFLTLGTPHEVTQSVGVRPRPADRVFMREAEDSRNTLGTAGLTGCSPCSGGEKVRNIGGSAAADVRFPDVTVDRAGTYTLFIDYTVNGDRSFLVSVNGGAPIEAAVSGIGNSTPATTTVPVTLAAGANTIRIYNDEESAPDLDRLSLGQP